MSVSRCVGFAMIFPFFCCCEKADHETDLGTVVRHYDGPPLPGNGL